MAITNYTELQSAIGNWLHRGDLTLVIPDFIALSEVRINGDIDARNQDTKTMIAVPAGAESVALPVDLINIRHASIATVPVRTLTYATPDTFESNYPWGDTRVPNVYTVIGEQMYLAPIPDADYSLDLVYKTKVPNLSVSVPTNWLLQKFPHVYLFAALCESATYLQDDARIQVWDVKYREAIDTVNSQDWHSGGLLRVKSDAMR